MRGGFSNDGNDLFRESTPIQTNRRFENVIKMIQMSTAMFEQFPEDKYT